MSHDMCLSTRARHKGIRSNSLGTHTCHVRATPTQEPGIMDALIEALQGIGTQHTVDDAHAAAIDTAPSAAASRASPCASPHPARSIIPPRNLHWDEVDGVPGARILRNVLSPTEVKTLCNAVLRTHAAATDGADGTQAPRRASQHHVPCRVPRQVLAPLCRRLRHAFPSTAGPKNKAPLAPEGQEISSFLRYVRRSIYPPHRLLAACSMTTYAFFFQSKDWLQNTHVIIPTRPRCAYMSSCFVQAIPLHHR